MPVVLFQTCGIHVQSRLYLGQEGGESLMMPPGVPLRRVEDVGRDSLLRRSSEELLAGSCRPFLAPLFSSSFTSSFKLIRRLLLLEATCSASILCSAGRVLTLVQDKEVSKLFPDATCLPLLLSSSSLQSSLLLLSVLLLLLERRSCGVLLLLFVLLILR